jgi:hypothetical protein
MSDTPPDSLIPYDDIVQEALRAVVGRVLGRWSMAAGFCRVTIISTSPSKLALRASIFRLT